MTATRILRPEAATGRPYVPGLVARGDLIFVSGQIPVRDGEIIDGPIESQLEIVFENVEGILRDAEAFLSDVVRCGVYLTNLDDLPRVNAVRASLRPAPAHPYDRGSHPPRIRMSVG